MEKYDTSQLTEFPRFESESNQGGVSTFFNKLWKFPIFSPTESGESSENKPSEKAEQQETEQTKQDYEDIKPEPASYAVEFEGRSLPNVLRRISSLVAMGSGGGTRYADTELARYWMPDDISRECYECAARFGALRRRHHCRVCGQIFCARCCSQRVPGHIFGCAGGLRVCTYCCNVVLSYLRDHDAGDISPDLRTLQENLQVKFPENKEQVSQKSRDFMFAREQDERGEARGCPREALQDVFRRLVCALPTQHHRYRLVRYIGVWRGGDVMQWVMDNTSYKTRSQAGALCQELLSAGLVESAVEPERFADYALYRPARAPEPDPKPEPAVEEGTTRLVESVSSYCLDLNLGTSSARLIKATKTETKTPSTSEEENPILDPQADVATESDGSGSGSGAGLCRAIAQSGEEHLRLLARQCLARRGLPPVWLDTIYALCRHAADLVCLDMLSSDMDVRNYVQVKKVPGGAIADSRVLPGLALTKNVAHRGMPQQISNPTVLLLDCSIAYQRVEGKLTSLEPVLMQEQEYLVRCAARISALRPKVVLVRGGAARAVQDALRREGVALAVGVRERALRRAARCAGADLVASIDARIGMPRLGTCKNFYVKNYSGKTLMVLEGCAEPQLGCCILLRGGSLQELIRVKKVVKFMLLACYNWKLEKAFLADIEASLPEPGTFDDDDRDITDEMNKRDVCKSERNCDDGDKLGDEINDDVFGAKSNDTLESDIASNASGNELSSENVKSSDDNDEINNMNVNKDGSQKHDSVTDGNSSSGYMKSNLESKTEGVKMNVDKSENGEQKQDHVTYLRDRESNSMETDTEASKSHAEDIKASTDLESKSELKSKEVDGSAQKAKPFTRKTDSDKNLSCGVPIRDFSDPLRSRMSVEDEVFLPQEEAKLKADTHSDRWSTDDVVLSMSPNIVIPAPPPELVLTRAPHAPHTPRALRRDAHRPQPARPALKPAHAFVSRAITRPADEPALRAALASYRAVGCRAAVDTHKRECPLYNNPCVIKKPEPEAEPSAREKENNEPIDPLSPENHQRLSLLLYSYSSKSPNVPDFCVNPWVVTMEMYGRHDIALGAFLERYCFNSHHKCSAAACHLPVNQHVRRFVHGEVCITITCNTIGHSNVDKPNEELNKQVMFWSRCERCGAVSRGSRLSRAALSLSLAQYVRARLAAPRYARAQCPHPLNEHSHAFVSRLTTACFRYNKISTYDIQFPPDVIEINYDTKQMREALIAQLNELMLKGHEIFSSVAEGEAEKEYQAFKQHSEGIHLALTSAHLHEPRLPAVVRSLWAVGDDIITGEKMLRDAQDKWASPSGKTRAHADSSAEDKVDAEDNTDVSNEVTDNSSKELEKEQGGAEEDEERGDKKTVKQILSQLLSNNQQQNQSGMIISSGLVPVVVRAGEIGSVIAATLASLTYQKTLRAQRHSTQAEQEEEGAEGERAKSAKADRHHIEVLLKDGLPCRVYYAPQFHRLRHMLLAPLGGAGGERCCQDRDKEGRGLCDIEEGFIRSLAHCVPWAARGGKSGSTFCKTKDDRYVLKEMTKPEWQQFLEFAPHYFNYVTQCRQRAQPSLLARILGVFSVGGSGSGVLVVEHVWYARPALAPRFDLKGTSRPRLAAAPAPPAAPQVLLDENLLRLRWETQLYVSSAAGAALWRGVERDTAFLQEHHVMDYSLLLGIDGRTLVLGIIDYIRTFTWDKKLEHLVKKNLGSGQPTVLSPLQYRRRFAAAARKYFLHCPRHWDHLAQLAPAPAAMPQR